MKNSKFKPAVKHPLKPVVKPVVEPTVKPIIESKELVKYEKRLADLANKPNIPALEANLKHALEILIAKEKEVNTQKTVLDASLIAAKKAVDDAEAALKV